MRLYQLSDDAAYRQAQREYDSRCDELEDVENETEKELELTEE